MKKLLKVLKFIIFASIFLLVGGLITMALWNSLIPLLFHGPVLTFWQTIGLLILSKILFGGFGRGGWGRDKRRDRCRDWKEKMGEKMKGMSEEEKQHFKENFKKSFTVNIN
jgi:hypothetical protein